MNFNFLKVEEPEKIDDIRDLFQSSFKISSLVEKKVSKILRCVKKSGDKAIIKFCLMFDGFDVKNIDDIKVTGEEVKKAHDKVLTEYPELVRALNLSSDNIKLYHENQLKNDSKTWSINPAKGKKLGQILIPIQRIGIYIPGGRYIYPSSVLMTVIPAKLAGVKEIAVCTPVKKDGNVNEVLLYLFSKLGIKEIYKVGGAQAIAAMAYGTDVIQKVDKIVGPGNVYVNTAKKKVFGEVGIDSLAGPSEVAVLSDSKANPDFIASDLLSQAEHDINARSILLSTDRNVAEKVISKIYSQISKLNDRNDRGLNLKIILQALKKNCRIIYNKDKDFLIKVCNNLAPEHLEIMMEEPDDVIKKIKNAGAIFIGDYTPAAVGDYIGGANHVLPTDRTARFSSPLGVYDFFKKSSITFYDYDMLKKEKDYLEILSEFEGLAAHKYSVRVRFKQTGEDK